MSNGIVSSYRSLTLLLALSAMAGCNTGLEQHPGSAAGRLDKESAQMSETYQDAERSALRIRTDTARGRVWLLSTEGQVRVYDRLSRRLLRQTSLPGWLIVRTPCMPDLILDRSGSAFISSNVTPWIWRINAESFEMAVHEVGMPGREGFDFGFAALAFNGTGMLYGLAPSGNSVWKIDVKSATANLINFYSPPLEECGLTAQVFDRHEASR